MKELYKNIVNPADVEINSMLITHEVFSDTRRPVQWVTALVCCSVPQ